MASAYLRRGLLDLTGEVVLLREVFLLREEASTLCLLDASSDLLGAKHLPLWRMHWKQRVTARDVLGSLLSGIKHPRSFLLTQDRHYQETVS